MNAVEIEEAVSDLANAPFDAREFPFAFLAGFGNKPVTIQRLRAGSGNASDVEGGVLQRSNIHMAVCVEGQVRETLLALRASPKTAANRVKFILATDGVVLEAEELATGEPLVCDYPKFADHFAFFLPLAGISTVRQIKDNPVDIKATGRLNKLYVELLKDNPDWATAERRPELNHFMARLIFCMFAEDTDIFQDGLFSKTVAQMSDGQSANTHEVMSELFRAMATPVGKRANAGIPSWADKFPYVNGNLFSDAGECPRFSRIARSYLLRAAELKWQEINPDIFGSMIQAVADDNERGELGMHYTSVPNILKVLNPLFLDDLREQLEAAGDSVRKLRALRRRIAAIRVFDPACGSGNFLVIAYKEMREIEHQIVERINDEPKSWIKLDNFYGIEIKSFAAEIARLALLIAEFQCDVRMISQQVARSMVLPLHKTGQIHVGNALQMKWLEICPPATSNVMVEYDLAGPTGRLALEESGPSETGEGEIYICGNPPYVWSNEQTDDQKADIEYIFSAVINSWKTLNYVSGWFLKAAQYMTFSNAVSAFVSTNTICQGQHVSLLWPPIFKIGCEINFAHTSFKWSNLATNNAGVTVVIVGISHPDTRQKRLFSSDADGNTSVKDAPYINAYLIPFRDVIVVKRSAPLGALPEMNFGNKPVDGGNLMMSREGIADLNLTKNQRTHLIRKIYGASEIIDGLSRYCLWIVDADKDEALEVPGIRERVERVRELRLNSSDFGPNAKSLRPHQFREMKYGRIQTLVMPAISSESRDYLPACLVANDSVITNRNYGIYDGPLWCLSLLVSRLHWVWISTVCGRLELRFSYANTLGWNTFPIAPLTDKNKVDLSRCAEEILLAREAHFPATIADLYDPEAMPDDLRHAHERNDETLERIYIGRTFRNDTERLEKLFDLYTRMTAFDAAGGKKGAKTTRSKVH